MAKEKPLDQLFEQGVFVRKWLAFVARPLQESECYYYFDEYSNRQAWLNINRYR